MERGRAIDAALAAVGVALALPTIFYPFSRDQALFFYVGREWALRGAIPYRDTFEVKTPFIYALHALLVLIAGEHMWAIRIAEIFAVVAIGVFAAYLVAPRWRAPVSGAIGASIAATSILYFGWLSFEDTANCEVWCVLFVLASGIAAQRIRGLARSAFCAGIFMGVALLAKPPCLFLIVLPLRYLQARRNLRGLVPFAFGIALPIVLCVAYFALHGALGALIDVEFGFVGHYIANDHVPLTLGTIARETFGHVDWFSPWSYVALAACMLSIIAGARRHKRIVVRRYAAPLVLAICVWASIVVQRRFFPYYFGLVLAPWSIFAAIAWTDLAARRKERTAAIAWALALFTTAIFMTPHDVYVDRARRVSGYLFGGRTYEWLIEGFDSGATDVDLVDGERAGAWIDAHAAPTDTLLV
ncbi:MAG: ArnT family glycosyltransferase, partial [Polyangiaceae bacterium]